MQRLADLEHGDRGEREHDGDHQLSELERALLDTEHGAQSRNVDRCERQQRRDDGSAQKPPVHVFEHGLRQDRTGTSAC